MPSDGSVTVENLTRAQGGIHIAGPRSRELLQSLTNANFGPEAFPFLGARLTRSGAQDAYELKYLPQPGTHIEISNLEPDAFGLNLTVKPCKLQIDRTRLRPRPFPGFVWLRSSR